MPDDTAQASAPGAPITQEAAREMLAALKLCLREIGDSERFTAQEAITTARAAIQRAEGRS